MNETTAHNNKTGRQELQEAVAEHPFVAGLSREQLAILTEYAMPTRFAAGQWIFREGESANRFYLILKGRVALCAERQGEQPVRVQTIGAGDVLGWSWLFPPYRWNFSAVALEQTEAIFFYGTWLRERCDEDPELGFAIMKRVVSIVTKRLQATRQQLIERQSAK